MDYDPSLYNQKADVSAPTKQLLDILHKKLDADFLENIVSQNGETIAPLIIDMGCGPGNTAIILSKSFPGATIIGLDIDFGMVKFANEHNTVTFDSDGNATANKCRFYKQDICADWDEGWPEDIKQILAGRVDAIFSNYAVHWTNHFGRLAQNVAHLLKPNGRSVFVGNLLYTGDILSKCETQAERQLIQSVVPYPTEKQFVADLLFAFRDAQFGQVELEYTEPPSFYSETYFRSSFVYVILNWYKKYIQWDKLEAMGYDNKFIEEKLKQLIYALRIKHKLPENQLELSQYLWTFTVSKL